jgi:hypothetical protein
MSPNDVFTPFSRRFTDEGARSLQELAQEVAETSSRHRLSRWSKADAMGDMCSKIIDLVQETASIPHCDPVIDAIETLLRELLCLETQIFMPVSIKTAQPLTFRHRIELKRHLLAQNRFLENESEHEDLIIRHIAGLILTLIEHLSSVAESPLSLRFIDQIAEPGIFIEAVVRHFSNKDVADAGVFSQLTDRLYRNLCEASGIDPDAESNRPIIWPSQAKKPPMELLDVYLHDTPLHALFSSPCPFELPTEQRYSGHWIVAPPGRGKTTLLHSMVIEDLKKDACVILMDSKGDLTEPFRAMKDIQDRVIIIDPSLEHPIGFNPLDVPQAELNQSIELLEYLFSSLLEFKLTPAQASLFRNVLRAIVIAFPNPTLETFRNILGPNGIKTHEHLIKTLPPDLQDFFATDFNDDTTRARRREVVQRLSLLLGNDIMRAMFTAANTRFRIAEAMDAGKVVIINNSIDILGDQGAEFFGRFFVTQVRAAGIARARRKQGEKKPVYFYIDEAQDVIKRDEFIPKILDQLRSQKVALILAHQRTEQIKLPDVLSALANCAIKYANSDEEAGYLAPKLRTTKEFLQSLPRGSFAAFVRDLTPHAIAFNVSKVDFTALPTLTPQEQASLKQKMSDEYGVSRPTAPPSPAAEPIVAAESPKAQKPPKALPPALRKKKEDPDTGSSSDGSPSW